MKRMLKLTIVISLSLMLCGCTNINIDQFEAITITATNVKDELIEFVSNMAEDQTETMADDRIQVFETEPTVLHDTQSIDVTETAEPIKTTEFEPSEIIGVEIDFANSKMEYMIGETVDSSSFTALALYSDGTDIELNSDEFVISEVDTSTYGEKEVIVKYGGFEYIFNIEVIYVITDISATTKYTTTSLNMRKGPSTQFDIITTLAQNSEVKVVGEVDNGWMHVEHNGNLYFCSGKYLSSSRTEVAHVISNRDYDSPYDNIITGEPGASVEIVEKANSYWNNKVPNWLKRKFVDNGWQMIVSGRSLARRFGYSFSIAGITLFDEKIVYLDNRESVIKRALVHELGHVVDYTYDFPSETSEFHDIFYSERYSYADVTDVGDGHHTSNAQEYFASVFDDIISRGENSLGDIPETYYFIMQYMN